jgi:PBP1b-binding outer membrane lipoprotein LpoB
MKKIITIVAVTLFLTSCGGASSTETTTTDSTSVTVDTTKVAVDTTKAVDTIKAAK